MASTDDPNRSRSQTAAEAPPVPITVALGRVGAQAEEQDFAGAFPILDEAQIAKLGRYGVEESVPAGYVFFREGERGSDFVLVLTGVVEAVAHFGDSGETTSTIFNPGQFVGVMNILSNEGAYVTATATEASRVLKVPLAQLRAVIGEDIALSEIVVRAFLLRHSLLLNFGFTVADIPLVLVAGRPILRNPSLEEVAAVFGIQADSTRLEEVYDLLVVGAGPAGLAASVYGGSEGLSTTVVEAVAVGGQAGTSSRIE